MLSARGTDRGFARRNAGAELDGSLRAGLWQQFGAAIDMLENAILACPDDLWNDRSRQPEFWYLTYHTLFWLDLYLSGSIDGFRPPSPFTRHPAACGRLGDR